MFHIQLSFNIHLYIYNIYLTFAIWIQQTTLTINILYSCSSELDAALTQIKHFASREP